MTGKYCTLFLSTFIFLDKILICLYHEVTDYFKSLVLILYWDFETLKYHRNPKNILEFITKFTTSLYSLLQCAKFNFEKCYENSNQNCRLSYCEITLSAKFSCVYKIREFSYISFMILHVHFPSILKQIFWYLSANKLPDCFSSRFPSLWIWNDHMAIQFFQLI